MLQITTFVEGILMLALLFARSVWALVAVMALISVFDLWDRHYRTWESVAGVPPRRCAQVGARVSPEAVNEAWPDRLPSPISCTGGGSGTNIEVVDR